MTPTRAHFRASRNTPPSPDLHSPLAALWGRAVWFVVGVAVAVQQWVTHINP